jgi:hypothetical protein
MAVSRRVVAAADPLAWVLVLAAFFDGISDNWVHAAVLAAAAAAVWFDAWARAEGRPGRPAVPLLRGTAGEPLPRNVVTVALVAGAAYCLVVGTWQLYTWPTTLAVAGVAVVALVVGWRGPLRARPVPPRVTRRTTVLWWSVVVAAGLWELQALFQQPDLRDGSYEHPTISYLMDSVLASEAGRTITLAAWLLLGWALLAAAPLPDREGGPASSQAYRSDDQRGGSS